MLVRVLVEGDEEEEGKGEEVDVEVEDEEDPKGGPRRVNLLAEWARRRGKV